MEEHDLKYLSMMGIEVRQGNGPSDVRLRPRPRRPDRGVTRGVPSKRRQQDPVSGGRSATNQEVQELSSLKSPGNRIHKPTPWLI
ncbi:hypothetical protein F2Q68_00004441 [Brassica cretica]|uniref:Uncharacterized protein n=1 Tax=Brassica cretica TaxID=69181 RepID=A0A8S9J978_BRACR|nr:hypothetical protein F2Q68_00004441 [Brassica cretica]